MMRINLNPSVSCAYIVLFFLVVILFGGTACQTSGKPPLKENGAGDTAPVEFLPVSPVAQAMHESGPYSDVFTPESYAVWVSADLAEKKHQLAATSGETIDPKLEDAARSVMARYVLIECHVESLFRDTAMAYDIVGFRNARISLQMPDGRDILPTQRVIGSPIEEEQRGALTAYRRTNLLLFPRQDLWSGVATLDPAASSVKLVVEVNNSRYVFEWARVGAAQPPQTPASDGMREVKVGFSALFEAVRRANEMTL